MQTEAIHVLTAWQGLLRDVCALGDGLCAAIEVGDPIAAIATTMQLRRVRSELARVDAQASVQGDRAEALALAGVAEQAVRAASAEAMMQQWLQRPLPHDDQLLASPLGVAVFADAMLPAVWDFELDLAVLVGPGLAPVAQVLVDLGQRRIVMLTAIPPAGIPGACLVVATTAELVLALRSFSSLPPARFVVRAAAGVLEEVTTKAIAVTQQGVADLRVHQNTMRNFSARWVQQGLVNLDGISKWPSVAALDQAFVGKPMVIIAPGPSLAKNVEQVKALQGRAVICVFSHSLRPVVAAGITPDLVLGVDPQDVQYHFAGCDLSETCIVNAATVHPALFELPAPRMLTLSANTEVDDWIFDAVGERALVPGGGSVATTAFSLALRWQCDPIVFVGLDLSFPGGEYYVSTSHDGNARATVAADGMMRVRGWSKGFHSMVATAGAAVLEERAIELPGWHGGTVPSSFMFGVFHRWFVEAMAALSGRPGAPTVFNCTEGGSAIAGMEHRPLAAVIPRLMVAVDAKGALDRAIAATDRATRRQRMGAHMDGYVRGLRKCRQLAIAALVECGRPGHRKLARIERELVRTLEPLSFASLLANRELERAESVVTHDREGTESSYLAASQHLFAAVIRVADQLEPALSAFVTRAAGPRR